MTEHESLQGIAVIGLAGRFPGAADVDRFWRNLCQGVEAITFFSDEELLAAGIPADRLRDPSYVRARGVLAGADLFDAGFFDYSPREAEVIDPQHRLFLECAWEALENAGYANERYTGAIGVYAGTSPNTYLLNNLLPQTQRSDLLRGMPAAIAGGSDYLTTRVSYKLDLRGPSLAVQTACSTSLVAVHLACQGLLDYQCDVALAGGASIRLPQVSGYSRQEAAILSPDGHCRAFDARAAGTVGGNGVGIVVLKRLEEALVDGDTIHAVILGTAVNNDGSSKVSYSAPSVDGQARVIALAQALAGVEPESVTYIEAHGTGTTLGDPIEVAALSKVFRAANTGQKSFCALGAVKTNIGHLDAAAGIAGLIKTVLALRHRQIPPNLHFERPNPEIGLEESPFYVSTRLADWDSGGRPRRAGVSSFGIGGTNAHAVLEEAPPSELSAPSRPWQLLVLSAKTPSALQMATERLATHLAGPSGQSLADIAHTLRVGRRSFPYRRAFVCRDAEEARELLSGRDLRRILDGCVDSFNRPATFLLSGLGEQYVGMGLGLYRHEPLFREPFDRCAELLKSDLGFDLRDLIYPQGLLDEEGTQGLDLRSLLGRGEKRRAIQLDRTDQVQPALFVVEYALAKLLMSWGIHPQSLLGYSLGEYVAACLAGVFSLEDALYVVTERARMIQELPAGAMLAVPLSEHRTAELLGRALSLAAVNGPELSVVAGPVEDVAALERSLAEGGIACRRLQTTHAFHSWMMKPIAGRLADLIKRVRRSPPSIPYLSNVTGRWISAAEATDPSYWAEHLCRTVRFSEGVAKLWRESGRVLIEVGPGQTLCSLALQHPASPVTERLAFPTLSSAHDRQPDQAYLHTTVGGLWVSGVSPDWAAFAAGERRRRVPLPAYPFERRRYWVDPPSGPPVAEPSTGETNAPGEWLRVPVWRRTALPRSHHASGSPWLVFMDRRGTGERLAQHLQRAGQQVVTVPAGEQPRDYDALLSDLKTSRILDLRSLGPERDELSFEVLPLVQALGRRGTEGPFRFTLVSEGAQPVTGEEPLSPEVAAVLGLLGVAASESPHGVFQGVDMVSFDDRSLARLTSELLSNRLDPFVAYRGGLRWIRGFDPILPPADEPSAFRRGGVYLFAGALRGVGLVLARHLAKKPARLALSGAEPGRAEELRRLGAEVLELEGALVAAVSTVRERLGLLDGILVELGDEAPTRLVDLDAMRWQSSICDTLGTVAALDEALSGQEPAVRLFLAPAGDAPGQALSAGRSMALVAALARHNQSGSPPWTLVRFTGGDLTQDGAAAVERALTVGEMPDLLVSTAALPGAGTGQETSSAHDRPAAPEVVRERRGHPRPKLRIAYAAPLSEVERAMTGLWEALLGIEGIGRHDNFFELGGHSLLGTQLILRIGDRLGVRPSLSDLFEAPTVEELSARIEQTRAEDRLSQAPPLVAAPRGPHLPLSFAQQRLWFLDQLEPGNSAYNLAGGVLLSGPLDVVALARALTEVVRRHEALRTIFAEVDGSPVQVVARATPFPLPVVDLAGLHTAGRESEVSRLASGEARRPFDLAQGPLLRALLLRLSEAEHALVITMHHIVSDGWSLGVLVGELSTIYDAVVRDQPCPLTELPVQYADFALWQRQWLRDEVLAELLSWWTRHLAGAPAALELPADRPRPALPSHRGSQVLLDLPETLTARLEEVGRRLGTTPFMTLLAAFSVLLSRLSGQSDLVVGTPIANRNRTEIEGLIGFFVNTLVLRMDLDGEPSFAGFAGQVRETALSAYAHQDLPFEKLVEELRPERALSQSPLFQVLFVLQNAPRLPWALPSLAATPLPAETGRVQFDLTFTLVPQDARLSVRAFYDHDLFDVTTVERMLLQYRNLLVALAEDPGQNFSLLPLLSEAERQQLAREWSDTAVEWSGGERIDDLLSASIWSAPEAVAVSCAGRIWTYSELGKWSGRLANHLRRLGVGPEVRVGLCLERSPELIAALVAITRAGGAYVPLDPAYPQERLAYLLSDSGARLVVTDERLSARLPSELRKVRIDWDRSLLEREAPEIEPSGGSGDSLAYTIYTSGSTGRPKGVLVSHAALVNLTWAFRTALDLKPADRFLMMPSIAFDASAGDVFPALTAGATLVLHPNSSDLSGEELQRLCEREGITVLDIPAALWQSWVDDMERRGVRDALPTLRKVIVGGESISWDRLGAWSDLTGGRSLVLGTYGPTEATVCSAFKPASGEGARGRQGRLPIGRPLANARIYLQERGLELAAPGAAGEVYIGGRGVARGYLNRPDLTAERFLPDPFTDEPGARMYRTGDLARLLPDGDLVFLGRVDHQVKIRGFRVEPDEVAAVMTRLPEVREAVVVVREGAAGSKRLVAYFVSQHGSVEIADLRATLQRELPDYMVPSAFVELKALPLTVHGKLDRARLPEPETQAKKAFAAPRTPAEGVLSRVWAEVLGRPEVGVFDNFFELGGDSILSIQVVSRAARQGLRLTPRQVFQHQTVAELAAVAVCSLPAEEDLGTAAGEVPLTPVQRWFFARELPDPHHWNQAMLFEVRRPLPPVVWEGAFRHLLAHHDSLRFHYVREEDGWRQFYGPSGGLIPFSVVDLSALPLEVRSAAVEAAGARLQTGFDLSRGPLLRGVLFPAGDSLPARLWIGVHHLAVDGVSWRILLEDLQEVCQQLSAGQNPEPSPKTTSFQRWAERLSEYARSPEPLRELDHWLAQASVPVRPLPPDLPCVSSDNTVAAAQTLSFRLTEEETRSLLQEVPGVYRSRIDDALLSALTEALAPWTGERRAWVHLESHGREEISEDVDLSRTVGWFTVGYPVLLDLRGVSDPGQGLQRVKEALRRVPNRGLGYSVLRHLSPDPEVRSRLRALPEPDVSFNYLGQFDQVIGEDALLRPAPEPPGPSQSPRGRRPYLLDVSGAVIRGRFQTSWTYSSRIHLAATVETTAQRFLAALRALIAHCRSSGSGRFIPADFPKARLSRSQLDKLVRKVNR